MRTMTLMMTLALVACSASTAEIEEPDTAAPLDTDAEDTDTDNPDTDDPSTWACHELNEVQCGERNDCAPVFASGQITTEVCPDVGSVPVSLSARGMGEAPYEGDEYSFRAEPHSMSESGSFDLNLEIGEDEFRYAGDLQLQAGPTTLLVQTADVNELCMMTTTLTVPLDLRWAVEFDEPSSRFTLQFDATSRPSTALPPHDYEFTNCDSLLATGTMLQYNYPLNTLMWQSLWYAYNNYIDELISELAELLEKQHRLDKFASCEKLDSSNPCYNGLTFAAGAEGDCRAFYDTCTPTNWTECDGLNELECGY